MSGLPRCRFTVRSTAGLGSSAEAEDLSFGLGIMHSKHNPSQIKSGSCMVAVSRLYVKLFAVPIKLVTYRWGP